MQLAHQLGADVHDWLMDTLPTGHRVVCLPPDDPWAVPPGTEVLLVANGVLKSLSRSRPEWAADLQWVHMRPTGIDAAPEWMFDVPHVTVSRGAAAEAIAEYALAAVLDFEKGLSAIAAQTPTEWRSSRTIGSLHGRTLGLLGYGEIGRAIAKRARPFGMRVIAHRRRNTAEDETDLVGFDDLCRVSDHLVLCAPLTQQTLGLFDDQAFARCKPGQHLINVARGALIEPDALRRALDTQIARATLDVWIEEPPPDGHWIYQHPKVLLTSHLSNRGSVTARRMQEILQANLEAWISGRPDRLFGRVSPTERY